MAEAESRIQCWFKQQMNLAALSDSGLREETLGTHRAVDDTRNVRLSVVLDIAALGWLFI
jgi:hypothetical protein